MDSSLSPPLSPVQIAGCNLFFIYIIFPDLPVAQLYDPICHIFNCIVVCDHDNRIAIAVIDLLDQPQNLFRRLIIE